MTAIVLAAGRGLRLRPLIYFIPKPLVPIRGTSIIERNLDVLPSCIERIVIVVRYRAAQIVRRIGNCYGGRLVHYVMQADACLGTGGALRSALMEWPGDSLVINGDDLYDGDDLTECADQRPSILLLKLTAREAARRYRGHRTTVLKDVAGPLGPDDIAINTGCYAVTSAVGADIVRTPAGWNGELGLPTLLTRANLTPVFRATWARQWHPVGRPGELARAVWRLTE